MRANQTGDVPSHQSSQEPGETSRERVPAVLVLESGRAFRGVALGAAGEAFGEAVFNTSMTGYQEILTDPSYAGQIVAMTASHIGNTGVNDEDVESARPWCAGFVVRESSPLASSWRQQGGLDAYLRRHGVVGIEGIDTRALTRALRTGGSQRAAIATGVTDEAAIRALVERVQASPSMEGLDLASTVSCAEPYAWPPAADGDAAGGIGGDLGSGIWYGVDAGETALPPADLHVVAYDFGIKQYILRHLRRVGCRVTVVPATTPAERVLAMGADGYFLSNGPGDPAAVGAAIASVRRLVDADEPVFGICLGHQILALALGARTYKLPFGHHGGNHPVKDLATGRVAITAHNHGFAVDAGSLPRGVECTHLDLYDDTVEGIAVAGRPIFGIQYHPEASPGPHDAVDLFARFVAAMRGIGS